MEMYMNENKLIVTKIEMTVHQMKCLKANKRVNGILKGKQLQDAVDLYIKEKGLESLIQK